MSNKPQWIDQYGETVKVGDTIRFFTLYGTRFAVVLDIIGNPKPILPNPWAMDRPVLFDIEPQQIGPEQVYPGVGFAPLARIESDHLWNVSKDVGRERDLSEIVKYESLEDTCSRLGLDPPSKKFA
ncbi:hypothetical protein CMI47_10080 [Candidatus Pacearchaeota archaeon]|jgi:hypothetical protein|nr:hypothetical protein [Candidatus Pacearchaeota archaeon]|tara:strand:+ start:518 stop:895 length:378 start_codon:yes stop_codon:yes gene_type:complete